MRTLKWALLSIGTLISSVALAGEPGNSFETAAAPGNTAAAGTATIRAAQPYVITYSAAGMSAPARRSTTLGSAPLLGNSFLESLKLGSAVAGSEAGDAMSELAHAKALNDIAPKAGGRLDTTTSEISLVQGIDTGGPFTPFLLGGIGAAYLTRSDGLDLKEVTLTNSLLFDFHLGAGVAFRLSEGLQMTAGYRYVTNLGSVAGFDQFSSSSRKFGNSSHVLGLSIRIPFGPID